MSLYSDHIQKIYGKSGVNETLKSIVKENAMFFYVI